MTATGFLSTPSARRATLGVRPLCNLSSDFYPRPPRGGRRVVISHRRRVYIFLSTPSARRATWKPKKSIPFRNDFYPRPPRGGRQGSYFPETLSDNDFYPRPPRGGRPSRQRSKSPSGSISIHALREEGDRSNTMFAHSRGVFLSTPSARRATAKTETKALFSNKLYNILHEFRRALIYNGSKSYPNHAK